MTGGALALSLALLAAGPPPYERASKLELWQRIVVCDGVKRSCESNVDRLEDKLATRTSTVIERLVVPPAPEPVASSGVSTPWVVVVGVGALVLGTVLGVLVAQRGGGTDVIIAK